MKSLSLNAKMIAVFAVFVAGIVSVAGIGDAKMSQIEEGLEAIVKVYSKRISIGGEIRGTFRLAAISEKNFLLEENKERMEEYRKKLADEVGLVHKKIDEATSIASDEGKQDLANFKQKFEEWEKVSAEVLKLATDGAQKEAVLLSRTVGQDLRLEAEKIIQASVEKSVKSISDRAIEADATYHQARRSILFVGVGAISLGLLFAFFVLRQLSRSIDSVVAKLGASSAAVTSAAHQIASSSEELSQSSTEQAASLEQTAASIEEMNSMVAKNSETATQAASVSEVSHVSAQKGKQVVGEMIRAIDDISVSNESIMQQINDSNQRISEIVKVISEIGNKTKIINEIVFQTKLLSFNASVEAARAGEHGKGFAVVAEEVGNLAQMSGNAAKDISSMLDASIEKVERIVVETKERVEKLVRLGKDKVDTGTRVAHECGTVLDEIVENVSRLNRMAGEISQASQEQARGIDEITRAMNQLEQVTQQNSSTSEEAAGSAEELSAQATALEGVVGTLIRTIRGSNVQAAAAVVQSHMTQESAAKSPNVVQLRQTGKPKGNTKVVAANPSSTSSGFKEAVGFQGAPSEDDPRFKE